MTDTYVTEPGAPQIAVAPDTGTALPDIQGRDLYQGITNRILAALEQGRIPWARPFPSYGKAAVHGNPVTGSTYTGINTLLCWLSAEVNGFRSSRWVTLRWLFEEGKKKGMALRRLPDAPEGKTGQRTTTVVYYGSIAEKVETEAGEEDVLERRFLKSYRVFNLDQIEGVPDDWIDDIENIPDVDRRRDEVDEFIDATGARVLYRGLTARYRLGPDEIWVPKWVHFLKGQGGNIEPALAQFNGARFHELVHWTGEASRLNRLDGVLGNRAAYAREELVAEIGAAFLNTRFGFDTILSHASYIGHWVDLLRADKKAIVRAASAASKAVEFLDGFQKKE